MKNEQMVSPSLAQMVPKKFIHEMESTKEEKASEVNQAASLGIVDKKYAQTEEQDQDDQDDEEEEPPKPKQKLTEKSKKNSYINKVMEDEEEV